jgi:hypothetical protein
VQYKFCNTEYFCDTNIGRLRAGTISAEGRDAVAAGAVQAACAVEASAMVCGRRLIRSPATLAAAPIAQVNCDKNSVDRRRQN